MAAGGDICTALIICRPSFIAGEITDLFAQDVSESQPRP